MLIRDTAAMMPTARFRFRQMMPARDAADADDANMIF